MLISIIIPAYNTASYIGRCLDSVCSQTYKDIEILIINDGSTDGTLSIIEDYAHKDKRIKVISFKQNRGNGIGRNMAIKEARGEYVMFVDSDDWISSEAVAKLEACVEGNLPDTVLYGYTLCKEAKKGKEKELRQILPEITGKESKESLMNMILVQQKGFSFAPWTYFCRREFLLENKIMFDESGRYFEDNIFSTKLVYYLKSISVLKENFYFYFLRGNSIMGCTSKKKVNDRIEAVLSVRDFLKSESVFSTYRDAYTFLFVFYAFYLPFMDYARMKEKDEQMEKFFWDLSQDDIIKTFNAKRLVIPEEAKGMDYFKLCKTLNSDVWMISHHFSFSLHLLRFLSRF